jgi:hypothetical protein
MMTPHLLKCCLGSLRQTTYENYEVLLLVNEAHRILPERAALLSHVAGNRIKVLVYPDQPGPAGRPLDFLKLLQCDC